jgi:hypothetical protein
MREAAHRSKRQSAEKLRIDDEGIDLQIAFVLIDAVANTQTALTSFHVFLHAMSLAPMRSLSQFFENAILQSTFWGSI